MLERLLSYLYKYINNDIEYTFEANPESLTLNKILLLKKYGVNRISIGVESTNDSILKTINRKHTFKDVINITNLLRENGFNNISYDLILGLPNVTLSMLEKDIKNLINLNPEHISCYSLTVHPNTVFHINGVIEPTDEFAREGYDLIHRVLKQSGYEQYEVSNWCKNNNRSKHNLTYWRNETYYGAGLGAAGYIDNYRYKNTRNICAYNLNKDLIEEKEFLNLKDVRDYQIILNLRTSEGLSLNNFKNTYGEDLLDTYKDVIFELIDSKLLILDMEKQALIPTYEGMMLLDTLILKLI